MSLAAATTSDVVKNRPRQGLRCALACGLAVAGFFTADALLFRTGLYTSILEPDSSAGVLEMTLRREIAAQARYRDNMIATFGDSRFAYSPKLSNQIAPKTGYIFRHAGVAGTNERIWYYILRDLDPTARRYRAIVFGVTDYDDEDEYYSPPDDLRALHYTIARLRWSDVPDFAMSYQSRKNQWEALRGSVLKGIVLQRDIFAFLSHPLKRLEYVDLCNRGYEDWTYNYEAPEGSMAGLQVDWTTFTAKFPPGVDQNQLDTVNNGLMRKPAPQIGRVAAFRRMWFGRILDRYRGSRTKIVFLRLPRGPFARPDGTVKKLSSSIREFASRPGVTLLDEHTFDSLEHPELFHDGLHLNRAGIARFSPMLAEEIGRTLGRPEASSHAF